MSKRAISLSDIRAAGHSVAFRKANPDIFPDERRVCFPSPGQLKCVLCKDTGFVCGEPCECIAKTDQVQSGAKRRKPRQMTRTEREFEAILRREFPGAAIHWEWYKLRIGDNCWYCPDFSVDGDPTPVGAVVWFFEVKGPYLFRGAHKSATTASLTKPKAAATLYPQHRFFVAQKAKDGTWTREEYLPA